MAKSISFLSVNFGTALGRRQESVFNSCFRCIRLRRGALPPHVVAFMKFLMIMCLSRELHRLRKLVRLQTMPKAMCEFIDEWVPCGVELCIDHSICRRRPCTMYPFEESCLSERICQTGSDTWPDFPTNDLGMGAH